jgi:hypothetical protein
MKLVPGTEMVPSNAIETLGPALTPPSSLPVGGNNLIVPEVEIVFPLAGEPKPGPAVIAVTVPFAVVERTPEVFTERPGPTEITPNDEVVATGKATPGNVCPGANVITPVITPPVLASAAFAVA